jgi:hypothetical protein
MLHYTRGDSDRFSLSLHRRRKLGRSNHCISNEKDHAELMGSVLTLTFLIRGNLEMGDVDS